MKSAHNENPSVNESMETNSQTTATLLYGAATALDSQWCEKDTTRLRELAKAFKDARPAARCSFCQRPTEDVHRLIAGSVASICNTCVSICTQTLLETPKDETKSIVGARFIVMSSPEDIEKFDFLAQPE